MKSASSEQRCGACGAVIRAATGGEPLARFCPMCGSPLGERDVSRPAPSPLPPESLEIVVKPAIADGAAARRSADVNVVTPIARGLGPNELPGSPLLRKCAFCQSAIGPNDDVAPCPFCGQPHHAECWRENGGCTVYGCRGQNLLGGIASPRAPQDQPTPPADAPVSSDTRPARYASNRPVCRAASESFFFGATSLLFSCVGIGFVFGPVALCKGQKALRELSRDRRLRGQEYAWAGQILGCVGALVSFLVLCNFLGCVG
jgi:hypothetical protein